MVDFSNITHIDNIVIESAVESFIEDGYDKDTDDLEIANQNKNSALSLLNSLKNKEPNLHLEHLRVMYLSLLYLQETITEADLPNLKNNKQQQIIKTCDKVIPKLDEVFSSFT